jgi:hypothetical protein
VRRLSIRVTTAAAAVTGVVVAHSMAALLAFPDGHQRAEHLAATGHAYWPAAVWVALAAGATAVALIAGRGARGARLATPRFAVLARGQIGVFVALEVVERIVAGVPLADLHHGVSFPLGVLVQVATAAVLTLVLRRLHRLAARVAACIRGPLRRRRSPSPWPPVRQAGPQSIVVGRVRSRAPPAGPAARPA